MEQESTKEAVEIIIKMPPEAWKVIWYAICIICGAGGALGTWQVVKKRPNSPINERFKE